MDSFGPNHAERGMLSLREIAALWQPRKGYRAGVDPVLLAATITCAGQGQRVLEAWVPGGGLPVRFVWGARVSGLQLTGVETSRPMPALARLKNPTFEVVEAAHRRHGPLALRQRNF